jgi:hypothetical protein
MIPDFTIPAGDNPTISGTVTGISSIAGYIITFSAKKGTNKSITPIFTKTAIIDNPTAGTFHFNLTSTDTNQVEDMYNYDIKVLDGSGNIMHTKRSVFEITAIVTS